MEKGQKGFSPIEGLLLLFIVGLLGFVGWYVYQSKNKTDKTLNNVANTNTTSSTTKVVKTTQTNQQQYLVIKEWSVRIKPAASLPNITYTLDSSNGFEEAKLTFRDLPTECAGFYHLNRAKSGQDINGHKDMNGNITTPEKLMASDLSSVKKAGDYYYILGHGDVGCSADAAVTDKQNTLIEQITGTNINSNGYTVEAIPANQ